MGVAAMTALMVISGVVPIKASSGHWAITAAFLDFAKTRSVSTYSWGVTAPALEDDALILRGAGHYETACRPCHGGPDRHVPPVMSAMTPPPPVLMDRVPRWAPEELFTIVKHGIKFTGMPAWPVQQRNDEIWAMVAFLRRMPQLDAAGYRRLVYGEREAQANLPSTGSESPPRAVRDVCWRCHGVDGTGRGQGAFPSIAGQRAPYLYGSLRAYRDRRRFSGIMGEIATRLSDDEMREIAMYFERLPARAPAASDDDARAQGGEIAAQGVPERDIPACVRMSWSDCVSEEPHLSQACSPTRALPEVATDPVAGTSARRNGERRSDARLRESAARGRDSGRRFLLFGSAGRSLNRACPSTAPPEYNPPCLLAARFRVAAQVRNLPSVAATPVPSCARGPRRR